MTGPLPVEQLGSMGLANSLEADTISNSSTSVHTLGMAAVLDTCSREMRGLDPVVCAPVGTTAGRSGP